MSDLQPRRTRHEVRRDRFERLYDDHAHRILGYALRRMGRHDDAADVVAEVFVVVWRKLDDVPGDSEALPWMYGVARRVLSNHHRTAERRDRLSLRLGREIRSLVDVAAPAREGPDIDAIVAAFGALADDDRELLGLVGWEELDREQIGLVLGCSRAAVRVRLHRARKRFTRELVARGVEPPQRHAGVGHEVPGWARAGLDKEEVR